MSPFRYAKGILFHHSAVAFRCLLDSFRRYALSALANLKSINFASRVTLEHHLNIDNRRKVGSRRLGKQLDLRLVCSLGKEPTIPCRNSDDEARLQLVMADGGLPYTFQRDSVLHSSSSHWSLSWSRADAGLACAPPDQPTA